MSQHEVEDPITGIHHVTAIATDPQRNLDFYTRTLGLRLVKLTVNFDDPTTYHFYYGDSSGTPGSILTFFPWPHAARGRRGTGQVTSLSFSVPMGSLGFWSRRLYSYGASFEESQKFGERVLVFTDPDNLLIELVEAEVPGGVEPCVTDEIGFDHAIRSIHSVALTEAEPEATATFVKEVLGFHEQERHPQRTRFRSPSGAAATLVDVVSAPHGEPGRVAAGTVHHVAFRTRDDASQERWRSRLARAGVGATPMRDRQYFHSIYFLEPGTVLFEIATDAPGFATDEKPEELGTSLRLPPWLEAHRERLEQALPRLRLPGRQSSPTAG